jgi:hypothetical protein
MKAASLIRYCLAYNDLRDHEKQKNRAEGRRWRMLHRSIDAFGRTGAPAARPENRPELQIFFQRLDRRVVLSHIGQGFTAHDLHIGRLAGTCIDREI